MTANPIPFRFKAGGSTPSMAASGVYHHRNDTSKPNKPFKSKFASKGLLKERAKGRLEERGVRKTPHQQIMSKIDRRHQARQKQLVKHESRVNANRIFSGSHRAPRNVAIISLTDDGDAVAAIRLLNESVEEDNTSGDDLIQLRVERFKQNLIYLPAKDGLLRALDVCRLADFVVLILSAHEEVGEDGQLLLKSIEGQGISNVYAVVQGLDMINPPKKRSPILTSLKSFINHYFPAVERVHSLDSRQECANVVRSLCTAMPKGIQWRDDRAYMLVEDVQWAKPSSTTVANTGTAILTGVVRGHGLKSDRLVHIPEWGDFQIEAIYDAPPSISSRKGKGRDGMLVDDRVFPDPLDRPTDDQDDLAVIAPEEVAMSDEPLTADFTDRKGVLLDDHYYFSEEEMEATKTSKKLPKGTSNYQSAWYLDDVSDSGSEVDETDDVKTMEVEDGPTIGDTMEEDGLTEAGPSEYPKSEAFLDKSLDEEMEEIQEYRTKRKDEAAEDLEFPDEIELHPNVLARERLAKYRGLKSLKTSAWNTEEDRSYEPPEWRHLLQITDYRSSRNRATHEALIGGMPPGNRVSVHLRNVPQSFQTSPTLSKPLALFSLLRHEHKHTVCNVNLTLTSSYPNPIKSKESLLLQCGPRRLAISPIFSSADTTPNNVHKFDRYLHPGRNAIASYIGPVTWGAVPCLVFKATNDPSKPLELIATATVEPPSPSRVIAKRAILTGHPYKIHKKLVTVRYMFFNATDVMWFKALQLWTRRGRTGFIRESLGTHGYFKATFDGKINPMDSVAVSLYKRVWPREAKIWMPGEGETTGLPLESTDAGLPNV